MVNTSPKAPKFEILQSLPATAGWYMHTSDPASFISDKWICVSASDESNPPSQKGVQTALEFLLGQTKTKIITSPSLRYYGNSVSLVEEAYRVKASVSGSVAVLTESSKSTDALVEELPYFEFGGIRMEKENHGRPPDGAGINIVTDARPFSNKIPECAENPNVPGEWTYNRRGAFQLARVLGKRIPSEEQMLTFLKAFHRTTEEQIHVLNSGVFPGWRSSDEGDKGEMLGCGQHAIWWVVSPNGAVCSVALEKGFDSVGLTHENHKSGLSVRFLWTEPETKAV